MIHDRDDSVFVAVQHPGEGGDWGAHTSYFPDFVPEGPLSGDEVAVPRPSVVQVFSTSGHNGHGPGKGKGNGKGKGRGRGRRDGESRRQGRWAESGPRRGEWNDGRGHGHGRGRGGRGD